MFNTGQTFRAKSDGARALIPIALALVVLFGGACKAAPTTVQPTAEPKEIVKSELPWIPPVPDGQKPVDVSWVRAIGRPFTGADAESALVTIVGYGDFACPDTRRGEQVVADLLKRHPEVRYTYVDHDVIGHPFGGVARRVAAIALKQFPPSPYWDVHEKMFGESFRKLEPGDEATVLAGLGLGPYREFEASENAEGRQIVNHREAESLGVSWAPTYFVNGVPIVDANPEHFEKLVTTQLQLARQVSEEQGLKGEALYREISGRNGAELPEDQSGTWHVIGYEVVGYEDVTREQIVAQAPMALGEVFAEIGPEECDAEKLGVASLDCSVLRYADFTAYVTMHVVEKGDEERLNFRDEPAATEPVIPDEVAGVFGDLEALLQQRFQTGQPPREHATEGFLDYDDEEMHALVLRLTELVPPHRELLFEVLENHRDAKVRGDAATLLNWAGDANASMARAHELLDDPSSLVRNNISRFMLHFLGGLEDAETRRAIAKSLLEQVRRPTMPDQNKALYGLLALAKTSEADREFIFSEGGEWLKKLAEQSVLTNVGGVARQLLALR